MKNKIVMHLLRFLGGVLIFLFVIWAGVIFWLGPRHVEARLIDDISSFWDGPVRVDGIDFGFFHPITVKRVILENKTGKPCLEAKGVTLLFKKWPSQDPQLTGIALDHLDLKIQIEEGRADLPFKKTTSSPSGEQEPSDPLGSFTVDDLAVHVSNTKAASMVLDDLSFLAVSQLTGYHLSLKQRSSTDSDNFSLSGDMNSKDSQVNMSLGLTKHVKKSLATGILSLLGRPLPFEFEGNVSANLLFNGTLSNLAQIQPKGTITLNDVSISKKNQIWVEKLNTEINVDDSGFHADKIWAHSFGGDIESTLSAEVRQNQLVQLTGKIEGKEIQVSELMQTLTVAEKSKGGNLAFVYEFTADEGKLQQMTSNGEIFLEHIDYQMLPVIAKIMSTVLLKDAEAQKTVHAYGAFTIDELIATLQHGRLANDWIAIEALPGVRLDLQTGDFDGYFFVAPIKQIHQVLHKIPVVRLFVDLKSNLVRLRVKGNHSDPSTIQVTKEPLRDVTKGTLEFVQGVAGTGGGFIKGLKDTPGILLKDREN